MPHWRVIRLLPLVLQENIKKKMGLRKLAYMKMVNTVNSTTKDQAKQEYTTLSKEITEICINNGALKEVVQSTASAATVELEKALRQNKKQKKLIEKAIAHVNNVNDIFGSGGVTDDEAVYIVLHFNALYTRVRPQTCWLLSHPLVRMRRFPAMSPLLRRLEARFLVLLLLLLLLPRQPHPMSVVHIRSWRPGDCWHSCT